jgi:hypothetical protein
VEILLVLPVMDQEAFSNPNVLTHAQKVITILIMSVPNVMFLVKLVVEVLTQIVNLVMKPNTYKMEHVRTLVMTTIMKMKTLTLVNLVTHHAKNVHVELPLVVSIVTTTPI